MLEDRDISELWKLFINGDDEAYAQIYSSLNRYMFKYGSCFSNDKEQVEDAIHDVFVYIYSNKKKLSEINNIKLYLLISLKNILTSNKSVNQPKRLDYIDFVYSTGYSAEEEMIAMECTSSKKNLLSKIFQSLSSRQKEAVYYRFIENMSYKDMAVRMDINTQSAKNIIQYTIKKIKDNFTLD